jgi:hypothetical protein
VFWLKWSLGEGEPAVALCKQAMAEGTNDPSTFALFWFAFEPLRDYPPYQELIRPKG